MSLNPAERAICAKIAAEITEHPERWTQGRWARDAEGDARFYTSAEAVCWCSLGFIYREFPRVGYRVETAFMDVIEGAGIADWNDLSGRTASEVAAVFFKLAEEPQS